MSADLSNHAPQASGAPAAAPPPVGGVAKPGVSLPEGRRQWRLIRESGLIAALALLVVVGCILSPDAFATWDNFWNVSRQVSIYGILGIGMTFVILTAGIDLSVGSIVGVTAIATASALTQGMPWPLALLFGLFAGAVVGALNGLGITLAGIQPFIMTLGMMVVARGATMTYSEGQPIPLRAIGKEVSWLFYGTVGPVPVPVFVFAGVAALAGFALTFTTFGRHVYAVGDNREAARLSGINTKRVIFFVYVISGACAAVSAIMIVSRLTAGEPSQGTGFELDAIAIVVIGGTSLFGGEGGVRGTLIGAAIVAVMANLLNLLGVSPFSQQIVKGLIILGAVLLERRGATGSEGK